MNGLFAITSGCVSAEVTVSSPLEINLISKIGLWVFS